MSDLRDFLIDPIRITFISFKRRNLYFTFLYSQSGTGFISGHADGTIVRFYVAEDGTAFPQVATKFY